MHGMKRRTLLHWLATVGAFAVAKPLRSLRLFAQPRELTPEALQTLYDVGSTVLPASLGPARVRATTDEFVVWTRGYREGVALTHGYGHPRLQRTGPSPVPTYIAQLAALAAEATARGAAW